MELHTIGIDLGKTVFHLVGLNPFHQGQELCAPTKAEYICADHPVTSFFACDKAADHTFRIARDSGAIRRHEQPTSPSVVEFL